jgi:hypothetical protein
MSDRLEVERQPTRFLERGGGIGRACHARDAHEGSTTIVVEEQDLVAHLNQPNRHSGR